MAYHPNFVPVHSLSSAALNQTSTSSRVSLYIQVTVFSTPYKLVHAEPLTPEVTTPHPIYPMFNAAAEVTRRPLSQDIHVFHVMCNVYLRITFEQVYHTK